MPMNEDLPLTQVSPLPMDNFFHLLFDMNEDKDALRIAIVVPPLVVSLPLDLAK